MTTIEASHDGVALFPSPIAVPGFESQGDWGVILSAGTSQEHDDDHWVDNLRLAASPGKPQPPALVNATTRTLSLSWFPPHHGGAPVLLYRLQRRVADRWLTSYIGNATQRIVGNLKGATQYLFRVQAYNSLGWGQYSDAGSFTTASPPLKFDLKPPHATRVAGGVTRCGGRLYVAGGQHAEAEPGVGKDGFGRKREYLVSLEQYDTSTRSWLRRASMRVPRSHPGLRACASAPCWSSAGTAPSASRHTTTRGR